MFGRVNTIETRVYMLLPRSLYPILRSYFFSFDFFLSLKPALNALNPFLSFFLLSPLPF
jgi:hypothetical protein